MKKRIISFLLASNMFLFFIPLSVNAEIINSGQCGDNLFWTFDSAGTLTISGTGDMWNYSYDNSAPWNGGEYLGDDDTKKIIIEEGVTSIGEYAFEGNSAKECILPDSLNVIGKYAFSWCQWIDECVINISKNVTYIGEGAFIRTSISAFNVSENNPNYTSCDGALFTKDMSTLINFPGGKIGDYTIPDITKNIESSAFAQGNLSKIYIGKHVETIGYQAFVDCFKLQSIDVNRDNTHFCSIDGNLLSKDGTRLLFYPAGKKDDVVIVNDSVTEIAEDAFMWCDMKQVVLPKGLKSIEHSAFWGCDMLTDVYYSGSREEWHKINIGGGNDSFFEATIHYNSKTPDPEIVPTYEWNYNPNEYNYDLAIECARLSAAMYGKYRYNAETDTFFESDTSSTKTKKEIFAQYSLPYHAAKNLDGVSEKDGINSIITHTLVDYNGMARDLIFVVCRGTSGKEWYGNMDITGTSYDSQIKNHYSFQKAASGLEKKIEKYIDDNNLSNALVVVTGHSRGAAVANLTAYDLTKGKVAEVDKNGVYGYTFACPSTTQNADTSLKNIYNFCFADDFVPAFPLDEWDYGKYGETHRISAEFLYMTDKGFKENINNIAKKSTGKKPEFAYLATKNVFAYTASKWKDTEAYYNANSFAINDVDGLIHLYNFCHDILASAKMKGVISGVAAINMVTLLRSNTYKPLASYILGGSIGGILSDKDITNLIPGSYLNDTHQMYTYYEALKTGYFDELEWLPLSGAGGGGGTVFSLASVNYNTTQTEAIQKFLKINNNAELLGWDVSNPSTWDTVIWNDNGNVEAISLYYKNLEGELDLTGFSDLKTLICPGNNITAIKLDGCNRLETLDCSNNMIVELNVKSDTLIALNCNGNYLDTEKLSYMEALSDSEVMINCMNQNPRTDAVYSESDLNILRNAFEDKNLWDMDNNPHLWYGIQWEKQNGIYRCVGIDIRDFEIEGALNLSGLDALRYLYCSGNNLGELDVTGCTSLENLSCANCSLTNLAADSNVMEFVNCEENYLDSQTIEKMSEAVGDGDALTKNQLTHTDLNMLDGFESKASVAAECGDNIVRVKITSNSEADTENFAVAVASYTDGALSSVEILSSEEKNGNLIFDGAIEGNTSKVMVWDDVNKMQPVCEPLVINK